MTYNLTNLNKIYILLNLITEPVLRPVHFETVNYHVHFFLLLMSCKITINGQKLFLPNVSQYTGAAISILYALTMNAKIFHFSHSAAETSS